MPRRFAESAGTPWREDAISGWAADLPALRGQDIAKAALQFKTGTGLGSDVFRPRWLCWLSNDLLDLFARILTSVEALGVWPGMVNLILVAQIPKSDGGRRPIGLLPTLVRVWEKARNP